MTGLCIYLIASIFIVWVLAAAEYISEGRDGPESFGLGFLWGLLGPVILPLGLIAAAVMFLAYRIAR